MLAESPKGIASLSPVGRAFSRLLSLPSQAQSVIKAFRRQGIGFADEFNTARFLLSRLESLSALLQVFQIFRGRAGRDCVFHFVPATDSPDSRIGVRMLVVLSDCLYLWRKDPYLPYECQCVRHLPRTNVLACSRCRMQFAIRYADAKSHSPPSSPKIYSRLSDSASLTAISRPRDVPSVYIYDVEEVLAGLLCRYL